MWEHTKLKLVTLDNGASIKVEMKCCISNLRWSSKLAIPRWCGPRNRVQKPMLICVKNGCVTYHARVKICKHHRSIVEREIVYLIMYLHGTVGANLSPYVHVGFRARRVSRNEISSQIRQNTSIRLTKFGILCQFSFGLKMLIGSGACMPERSIDLSIVGRKTSSGNSDSNECNNCCLTGQVNFPRRFVL
jgi:hypothetical protein